MMQPKAKRISNIESLRCLAMFFIVMNHCILHIATKSIILDSEPVNFCITEFLYQVVYNGVNVFVLISGYFLSKQTREFTNWEKVEVLWLTTFFYSISIYMVLLILRYEPFSISGLIHSLMPIRYNSYWFITQYLGLYIISPFLSKWARSMSKREYKIMLVSFFIITSVIQLHGLKGGFSLIWFIFLFMFAGYIQFYMGKSVFLQKWKQNSGFVFITVSFLLFVMSFLMNGNKLNIVSYWGFYNGPLLFVASVSIFIFFLKIKTSGIIGIISKLSPYMLGVYLIHEHPLLRLLFWNFLNEKNIKINILNLSVIAFAIMAICIFVEYFRVFIFKIFKIDTLFIKTSKIVLSPIVKIYKDLIVK